MGDREHIVDVPARDMDRLRRWMARPNGSLTLGRVVFNAVEGGGVMVRTWPYGAAEVELLHLAHVRTETGEEFGLYRNREKAEDWADDQAGKGVLTEVIGLSVIEGGLT